MNKNQKLLLGVAVVGLGGYLLWRSTRRNFVGFMAAVAPPKSKCCGHVSVSKDTDGKDVYKCCDRKSYAGASDNKKCEDCLKLAGVSAASE